MAGKDIPAAGAALTADGTADGSVTVASTTPFRAKAVGWINDNNSPALEVQVVEIVSATVMRLRALPARRAMNQYDKAGQVGLAGPNYGSSDMSAYTVAQSARVDFPAQFIYDEPR